MFGSLEGRGGEGFGKKEGASGRNRRHWEEKALEVNFLLIIKNPPHLGELKNCIGGGFWGVYMNFSNSIYVVIIFLKLKVY